MDHYGYKTTIIVSDTLNMKRTMLMVKAVCIDAYSTLTTMYKSACSQKKFLE